VSDKTPTIQCFSFVDIKQGSLFDINVNIP